MEQLFKGLKVEDGNIAFLLTDKNHRIKFMSAASLSWFGTFFKQEEIMPSSLRTTRLLELVSFEGNEYVSMSSILRHEKGEYYYLYIILKYGSVKQRLTQEIQYNVFYEEMKSIIDCITDGIYIADGQGKTLMLNKAAEKAWSIPAEELIGKSIYDLWKRLDPSLTKEEVEGHSVCLQVIKSRKPVSLIQSGRKDQFKILSTAIPYFEEGRISKVVSTERNLTELIELRDELEKKREMATKYEAELQYYRSLHIKGQNIIVKDEKMEDIAQLAYRVSGQDTTVLIQGESGVGKEVMARFIHDNSPRKDKPFIEINCAAIPENLLESELFGYEKGAFTGASASGKIGLFELADGGTLFLDEITELPIHLQSKLLRVIQEKNLTRIGGMRTIPIDIRIISATNLNMKEEVEAKKFREDLYYRLNVVKITIPALRERKEDVHALIPHFLKIYNEKNNKNVRFSPDALNVLYRYGWPGNIRELSNVVEAVIATSDLERIDAIQLLEQFPEMKPEIGFDFKGNPEVSGLKEEIELYEMRYIEAKLQSYKSAQSLADALKIDKSTLLRKMHRYQIPNPYI